MLEVLRASWLALVAVLVTACGAPTVPNGASATPSFVPWAALPPTGVFPQPGATISDVISIKAPVSVLRNATFVYFVSVKNTSSIDYRLDPCPDYNEFLGPKQVVASYRLNCAPVGHISPGSTVTFEMRMPVPSYIPTGPNQISWVLIDDRLASPSSTAGIRVTA